MEKIQKVLDLLDKIKAGEVNIRELSKESGISEGKMYKWKVRGSDILLSDAILLIKWMDKSLTIPAVSSSPQDRDLQLIAGQIQVNHEEVRNRLALIEKVIAQALQSQSDIPEAVQQMNKIVKKGIASGTGKKNKD